LKGGFFRLTTIKQGENTMALATLAPKETGATVAILHPVTRLETGITVTVLGTDSDVCKKVQRKQLNRRLELQTKSRSNKFSMTAEELEKEALDVLVACVVGWHTGERPEIEMNEGEWLPCTPDNVKRVLTELPWLKEQLDQEIGDRANFLPA
jgi:hypothetical protein